MKPAIKTEDKPSFEKNVPVLTFFSRNWMLTLFMLVSNWATLSKIEYFSKVLPDGSKQGVTLFEMLGAVLYVPAIASVVFFVTLLGIHLFFRDTLDKDAHGGQYIADWHSLCPRDRAWIGTAIRVGFLIAFCILCSSMARGDTPDQRARWDAAKINPNHSMALDISTALFKRNAARYQKITAMRKNGVPSNVIFCLHQRESSGNFLCHPHEGSALTGRTRFIPRGRLPAPATPPFSFEQSAEDAYYNCDRLDLINWKSLQDSLWGIEKFNGTGYSRYHPDVPSPYLWSGTTIYSRGKYVADGKFNRMARDGQLGVAAILKRMQEQGIKTPWDYVSWKPPFDPRY